MLRLGEITAVTVPEREIEAARDLVRAREDARADLMRVRHRLSKLLLRQGRVYSGGQAWTGVHETWLRRQRFDDAHTGAAFDHHFDAVLNAPPPAMVSMSRSLGSRPRPGSWTRLVVGSLLLGWLAGGVGKLE